MKAYTHIIWAIIITVYFLAPSGLANLIAYIVLATVFSILCDIDHPNSKIGKHFKLVNWLFVHRGFFHSLFFVALVVVLLEVTKQQWIIPIALIGLLSHLFLDALTKQGIQPLYPLPWKVAGPTKTGGVVDFVLSVGGLIVLVYLFI
jgi:inner membrane protein